MSSSSSFNGTLRDRKSKFRDQVVENSEFESRIFFSTTRSKEIWEGKQLIRSSQIYFERENFSLSLSLSVPVLRTQLVYKSNECRSALVDYSSGKKKITNIGEGRGRRGKIAWRRDGQVRGERERERIGRRKIGGREYNARNRNSVDSVN